MNRSSDEIFKRIINVGSLKMHQKFIEPFFILFRKKEENKLYKDFFFTPLF